MAAALGSRVYRGTKEIGWSSLEPTEEGHRIGLGAFGARDSQTNPGAEVLHWHGETFDLPGDATRLAANSNYENQAFALGDWALAFQFHIEVRYPDLERWLVGHTVELHAAGIDINTLRHDCIRLAPALGAAAEVLMCRWLSNLAGN
jgi:GMP synthase (glutamine-hydrolysing)